MSHYWEKGDENNESRLLVHDLPVNGHLVSHRFICPQLYGKHRRVLEFALGGAALVLVSLIGMYTEWEE